MSLNPNHIIELLYQQIRADQLHTNIQDVVPIAPSDEFYNILHQGGIDNWHIVLDMMGFPDDQGDNESELPRDWIYTHYYEILEDSYQKEEHDIKTDLYTHYEFLNDVLDAFKSNNQAQLDLLFQQMEELTQQRQLKHRKTKRFLDNL